MAHARARKAVAALYRELGRIGLIVGSSGNVSVRVADGMVVTPSGGSPDGAAPGGMAHTTFDAITASREDFMSGSRAMSAKTSFSARA